ncbi:MAG: hypothetical protein R6V44_02565 [Paracoccaceae bacterium]
MPEFVYDVPTEALAIWFSAAAIAAVLLGIFVVKPVLRLLLGTGPDFNASINYATSGFSLFYGLLLGLLTVAAYQNAERVRVSMMAEATTFGSIYSQMDTYPEPLSGDVKEMMRDYVLYTIHEEWPAHRAGRILNGGYNRAAAIRRSLGRFEPETEGQRIVHGEVVAAYQDFSAARQQRLAGVLIEIPDILWYAVLVGAAISILLLTLLRIPVLQHVVLGSFTGFFLGVILFVITTLDRPLRGEAGLEPEPMVLLWERAMVWDDPLGGSR